MKYLIIAFLIVVMTPSFARWKNEYVSFSPEEKAWYARQQTTEETRKRLNASWYKYCCDEADRVDAKFKFDRSTGQWFYQMKGSDQWKQIPEDTIQPLVDTPHGEAILFIDQTYLNAGPVCFFPGGGGT